MNESVGGGLSEPTSLDLLASRGSSSQFPCQSCLSTGGRLRDHCHSLPALPARLVPNPSPHALGPKVPLHFLADCPPPLALWFLGADADRLQLCGRGTAHGPDTSGLVSPPLAGRGTKPRPRVWIVQGKPTMVPLRELKGTRVADIIADDTAPSSHGLLLGWGCGPSCAPRTAQLNGGAALQETPFRFSCFVRERHWPQGTRRPRCSGLVRF